MKVKESENKKMGNSKIEKFNNNMFKIEDKEDEKVIVEEIVIVESSTIPLEKLVSYKDHKFDLLEGIAADELRKSIEAMGVITPIIAREIENGMFEILSGHNRVAAARGLELVEIPAVVKKGLGEDEALEIVLVSNLNQRSLNDMKPSARAAVIAQYYKLLKKLNTRNDLTEEKTEDEAGGMNKVGEKFELSRQQISKYKKIDSLDEGLKKKLDEGKIDINASVVLSKLSQNTQKVLFDYLQENKLKLSKLEDLIKLDISKRSQGKDVDLEMLEDLFKKEERETTTKIGLSDFDMERFFDKKVSKKLIYPKLIAALEIYVKEHGQIE